MVEELNSNQEELVDNEAPEVKKEEAPKKKPTRLKTKKVVAEEKTEKKSLPEKSQKTLDSGDTENSIVNRLPGTKEKKELSRGEKLAYQLIAKARNGF